MRAWTRPKPASLYTAMGFAQGLLWGSWWLAGAVWWIVELELSPLRLILLGTFMEATVLLAESPTGVMADVFSRKWSVVLSWVLIGVGQALGPISEVFVLLVLWQMIWAFGYTFQSGADTAWVTDELGYEDDRLIFRHAIARTIGVIVGILAAMAATQWSLKGTMVLAGLASIVFAAFLGATMQETNFEPADTGGGSVLNRAVGTWSVMVSTWRRGFALTKNKPVLRLLAVAMFIASFVDEMVDRLDMKRVIEIGFPAPDGPSAAVTFGWIWILMSVITLPVMVALDRTRTDFSNRWSAVILSALLGGAAVGVGMMAGSILALAVIGWVLRDVVREVAMPVATAWTNRQAPSDVRATVLSFQSQSVAFGQAVGGVAIGVLAEATSLSVAFAVGAALMAVASISVGTLAVRE